VAGNGEPVVLIHGYSASVRTNWRMSGCIDTLAVRYRVIAPDLRGHGRSEKPRQRDAYSIDQLAADVLAVMDAEGVDRARIAGYSMGGMVALELLLNHAARVSAAVIGGMGSSFPRRIRDCDTCRECEDGDDEVEPVRRFSRRFLRAYLGTLDPLAIYAAYRGILRKGQPVDVGRLGEISAPVLCVAGTRDHLCQSVRTLAAAIRGAQLVLLPGQSHLSAIADPRFREAMLEFFAST
jgi:pimeloyl-ACP methyl ester carboxylesterase